MDELSMTCYESMWGPNEFTLAGTLRGVDFRPAVKTLKAPSLWLCGSQDEARPETIRAFAEMSPAGTFLEFAGASHCVHLEQTEAYLSVVREFLSNDKSAQTVGAI
jgi:proline iminopeptidase